MNSSNIIENTTSENETSDALSFIDSSLDNSAVKRPSFDHVVEESYLEDNNSRISEEFSVQAEQQMQSPHQNRNNSCISSDEDADYGVISRTARKSRVRKIASDSEDEEYEQNTPVTNLSFANHRSTKLLDSDEDDYDDGTSMKNSYNEVNSSGESDNNVENISVTNVVENVDEYLSESNISQTEKNDEPSSNKPENVISIESSDDDTLESNVLKPIETNTKLQQLTLDEVVKNMSLTEASEEENKNEIYCSAAEYANQSTKISNLRSDILRCKNILRTVHILSLPDKGALLLQRQNNLEKQLKDEEDMLKKMVVSDKQNADNTQKISWEQLHANSAYVVPSTFGKQAMNTYVTQKTVTMNRLKNLHDSLASCPNADTQAEDPKGLKVNLMPHQKHGLAWLLWRESQTPAGGILADDMGLGKTLTIISLILASQDMDIKENESDEESNGWTSKDSKYCVEGGTLVICPASLIRQWESEIDTKVKRNLLSCEVYHGIKRESRASRLAKYDVVVTTYKLAQNEFEKKGPLHQVKWKRIVLDEGHIIRNHKSQTSVAICNLKAKARWVLTGTPVHNKELDLYALLKFLRCSPFDDLAVWKRWVANKNAGGQERLNTVITSILLRRTKNQLQSQGSLQSLPEKKFEIIDVKLDSSEKQVYEKVLVFSRTLFIQFLRQRAEKNPDFTNIKGGNLTQTNDEEYNKMYRKIMQMHGNTEVKSHEILVLLLRLRQICCHPSLISSMLNEEVCDVEGIEEDGVDVDLLDKLNNLNLDEEDENPTTENSETFTSAASKVLNPANEVFSTNRANEKLRVIKQIIEEKVLPNNDKVIVVSQWTSMLNVIMCHLKEAKIRCNILDGKVPVHKRNDIVEDFNNPNSKTKVLLLSLTAGGVGLNLVGANHLLLVDLHWNPQLESQAQDRIYRVGQKKTVYIYKIVTSDTIEEKIKNLQDNKLSLAEDILSGVKHGAGSKLSLDDLKMLFSVAG